MSGSSELEQLQHLVQTLQQENQQLRDGYLSLSQQLLGLRMVQHVTQDLVSEMDIDRLLERILHSAIHSVQGTAGALLLLDPSGQSPLREKGELSPEIVIVCSSTGARREVRAHARE